MFFGINQVASCLKVIYFAIVEIVDVEVVRIGVVVLHKISSDPSWQSAVPSHTHFSGMQNCGLYRHWNEFSSQENTSGRKSLFF